MHVCWSRKRTNWLQAGQHCQSLDLQLAVLNSYDIKNMEQISAEFKRKNRKKAWLGGKVDDGRWFSITSNGKYSLIFIFFVVTVIKKFATHQTLIHLK